MIPQLLTDAEFKATFAPPMRDVTEAATDVVDIWPYVRAVPAADLGGHQVWDDFVECVYRAGDGRYDHVLVMTRSANVYPVVVVDLVSGGVHGHRLLDLNREYGLS